MASDAADTDQELLGHVLLPVAHEEDARKTAAALEPYDPDRVTALHVVEKGEGVPDKTPVAQSEEVAEESYAAVREVFPGADDHTAYARDVVGAIFESAEGVGATDRGLLSRIISGSLVIEAIEALETPVLLAERPSTRSIRERLFGRR